MPAPTRREFLATVTLLVAHPRPTLALVGATPETVAILHRAISQGARLGPPAVSAAGSFYNPEVDAIVTHDPEAAIRACRAGKDVYYAGQHHLAEIRDAAAAHKRIVQVNLPRRSLHHYRSAVNYIATGRLGRIDLAQCGNLGALHIARWATPAMLSLAPCRETSIRFHGTEGTLLLNDRRWELHPRDGSPARIVLNSGGSHEKNFLDCIRTRDPANADVRHETIQICSESLFC